MQEPMINQNQLLKFPLRSVLAVIALSVIFFIVIGAINTHNILAFKTIADRELRIHKLQYELLRADKLSNTTVKMYILTQDEKWKNQYQEYEKIITRTLRELSDAIKLPQAIIVLEKARQANDAQTQTETQAFAFIKQDKKEAARQAIFSERYEQSILAYERGMGDLAEVLRQNTEKNIHQEIQAATYSKILIACTGFLWLILFYFGYRRLIQWKKLLEGLNQSLNASKKRYHNLMTNASCGIFIVNRESNILNANTCGEVLLGLSEQQMLGRNFLDFIDDKDKEYVRHLLENILSNTPHSPALSFKEIIVRPVNRSCRTIYSSVFLENIGAERLLQIVTTDITEVNTLKTHAVLQDRLTNMGMLAAGIAHEINNPLSWILGNLELLRSHVKHLMLNPNQPELLKKFDAMVEKTIEGSKRVSVIVNNFLGFSRNDESKLEKVDINEILNAVIEMITHELKSRATLEKRWAHDLPLVMGNKGKLHQVFLNLLINAVQAKLKGSVKENKIQVIASLAKKNVVIEIRDTGNGIKPEDMPHIFDLFFTTKPVGEGTGCGLFICQDIIQKMGGEIKVESTVGQGTSFFVYLAIDEGDLN